MKLYLLLKRLIDASNISSKTYSALAYVIAFLGVLLVLGILFPTAVIVLFNTIWILLLAVVVVFFTLGVLVLIGMKEEVGKFLDVLLEGSLTILDFIDFVKNLYKRFLIALKEFLIFAAPVMAYTLALITYVVIIVVYKTISLEHDVTILTIVLTIASVLSLAVLNTVRRAPNSAAWAVQLGQAFKQAYSDGLEIALFLFFLTMDSTHLFFLPKNLNIPLRAEIGFYDLMTRSFVYNDHLRVTINLIIMAIVSETARNIIRVVYVAKMYYSQQTEPFNKSPRIKSAVRKSFFDAKDDIIRFIAFTTLLFIVFLVFPRLKLLTLVVASVGSLFLDILIKERLKVVRGTDLISRILQKVFRI